MKRMAAEEQEIEVLNPDARHHIGVGLVAPVTVRVRGSAGYFCAGLADGARFEVEGNAGWGLADNMYNGTVSVDGNASTIAGVAIRGAEVVVKGNLGSRAGQVMKAGTLCCAGNASFMAGYMMYGGRIILLGDSGEKVGEDMIGGEIFVGGKLQSLGSDACEFDVSTVESSAVAEFLDKHHISHSGHFRKVGNAGTKLRYKGEEERIRPIPFFNFSGDAPYWNRKVQEDIFVKSKIGRYRIRGYGAARRLPHFSDIGFKADLSTPVDDENLLEKVKLDLQIGDKSGAHPLELSMPVTVAAMSYGALSKSTKIALSIASRLSGISENTGEGGLTDEQRKEADQVIMQCLGGRLGWNIHDMLRADALEIYISQGAKPGFGGQLLAKKVTRELAEIRGIPEGIDLKSPSRHPDILGADDLVIKIQELREATDYRLPVSLKLGAGRVRDDIKIALKSTADFVELDGSQGSTGASSSEVLEYVGIPTLAAIQEAMDALEEIGRAGELPVVLMGGIKDGVDVAKALALGASATAMGTALIIAGGCISCMQCHAGTCVVGIATQDSIHENRYDVPAEARNIHHFLEHVRWQLASIVHRLGYDDFRQLSRSDLVALTPEAAAITRLPYAPEYRRQPTPFSQVKPLLAERY